MKRFWTRLRSAGRVLRRSDQLESEMRDEMRFHVELEAERLAREDGLDPREARRQAHVRFGGVEKYKEAGRDARGMQWVDAIGLDARLGARMLVKHRGLSLVGGFAMAVAIAVGALGFEVLTEMLSPSLPLEEGDRVVAVQYASLDSGNPERRVLHDFVVLRDELVSIEQLGAFRTVQHNLVSTDGPAEPIKVAEITPSGFTVARTPALMGRYLLPSDERDGASPVVVIGHQAWRSRFHGDPRIVGRTVILGGTAHTVAGVMPDRFKFPVDHQFWIPLRVNPPEHTRLAGPQLYLFGRLAPGVTLEKAQAELTIIGQRAADAYPDTHARLRPRVLPYTREHLDLTQPALVWALRAAQLLVGALVFVVAVNLAILFYARTVTRLGEIALRSALGASRRRILAQLFIEALVLSILGAGTGLVLANIALRRIQELAPANGAVPFWLRFDLSPATAAYAIGLAVLAALIMGVLPGLKATGRSLNANLHELNGRSGTRLGPMWTALVVAQVAVAVAVLPVAVYMSWQVIRMELTGPGFAAEQFMVTNLTLPGEDWRAARSRIGAPQAALMSRLEAEPGVAAVTFTSAVPGFAADRLIQLEHGVPAGDTGALDVNEIHVGLNAFSVYDAAIVAGRGFVPGDIGAARAVIVNRTFVRDFLGTQSALGLRFRYARSQQSETAPDAPPEWYQIVGVVEDFPSFAPDPGSDGAPVVYHPSRVGDLHPVVLSVRYNGQIPVGAAARLRTIGAEVDPALQLRRLQPLSVFYNQVRSMWRYLGWGIGLVTMSVLLLSAAGIYALLSFTVAQRTREIGIRAALGAHPRRLLLSIFGRVVRQLALGLMLGTLVSGAVFFATGFGIDRAPALLLAVAVLMTTVGLLAALGPARRSLRIQAIEALRAE